jgi:CBS domain-containing protein
MDIQLLTVADIMHSDVHTVSEDVPLTEAAHLMHRLGVSCLIVDKKDPADAYGILTRKDVVSAFLFDVPGMEPVNVEDAMTKPAITIAPGLALRHAVRLMRMVGVRRLPVEKDGSLVGILSNSDLFRCLVENVS